MQLRYDTFASGYQRGTVTGKCLMGWVNKTDNSVDRKWKYILDHQVVLGTKTDQREGDYRNFEFVMEDYVGAMPRGEWQLRVMYWVVCKILIHFVCYRLIVKYRILSYSFVLSKTSTPALEVKYVLSCSELLILLIEPIITDGMTITTKPLI